MATGDPTGGPIDTTRGASAEDVRNQSEFYELLVESVKKEEQLLKLQKERAAALGLSNELFEKEIEFQNRVLLNLSTKVKDLGKVLVSEQDILEAKKLQQVEQKELQRLESFSSFELNEASKERLAQLKEEVAKRQELIDVGAVSYRDLLKASGLQEDMMETQLSNGKSLLQTLEENIGNHDAQIDALEEARGINQSILQINGKISNMTSKVATSMGLSADASDTFLGSQLDILVSMRAIEGSNVSLFDMIGKNIDQAFGLQKVFFDLADIIISMVGQLDAVGKKIGAATGLGNQFGSTIMTTFSATVAGGGTMEEAGTAIEALATGFSKFDPAADAVNEHLATTIVRLGKIGVDAGAAVGAMEFFTRNLRMSETAAADLAVELAQMGQVMGKTSKQMMEDFAAVSDSLAIFGDSAIDVFADLEAQSKATGVEINSLIKIASQFDTFDKAADSAAQLNAVLGTQISTLDMMSMKYDDRVSYLRQEISFSVGNMENLDMYTQQYIAQALGVSSVAEAQKLLNMSQAEYLGLQGDMDAANKRQEELAELTKELVPIMDQLKIAFMKMATALEGPISLLTKLLGIIAPYFDLIVYGTLIYKGIIAVMTIFNTLKGISIARTLLETEATNAQRIAELSNQGIKKAGIALDYAQATSKGVLASATGVLSTAFKGLNISMGPFILAMLAVVAIFAMRINPLFIHAFSFLASGVTTLGAAFNTIQGPAMLAMLVFSLMVGVLALFVYSLKELVVTLVESGTGLYMAAGGMYAIAGGITAIAAAMFMLGPMGIIGLIAMASTLATMGDGMEKMSNGLERISKLSTALSGLGSNGLIAVSSDGTSTSALMGTGDVFQNFSGGKMEVEVKMPKAQTPKFELKVELMGEKLEAFVREVVEKRMGPIG